MRYSSTGGTRGLRSRFWTCLSEFNTIWRTAAHQGTTSAVESRRGRLCIRFKHTPAYTQFLLARYSTTNGQGDPPGGDSSNRFGWGSKSKYASGSRVGHGRVPRVLSGLSDAPGTPRYALYEAISNLDPDDVWGRFNDMAQGNHWHRVTEYDVCRVLQIFNHQYAYEHDQEALTRGDAVVGICDRHGMQFKTSFAYNECIRLYVYKGKRDMALKIKEQMDEGVYGPDAQTDIYTYRSLLNDPHTNNLDDLTQLIGLYDEMLTRGIESTELVKKPLLKAARKIGELRLVEALLDTPLENRQRYFSTTAARLLSNKAQAYIALHKLSPATAQLHKLLLYQIPKDIRSIPSIHLQEEETTSTAVPLEYSRTREAFFIYLRSLYESIIRIRIIRRNPRHAQELLEDMRRNCYLPPTRMAYNWFIRFHSKRKNISKLREIYDMMLQDGVTPDEHAYTKLITACMFSPKRRLLVTLVAKESAKRDQLKSKRLKKSSDPEQQVSTNINVDDLDMRPPPRHSGLPKIPLDEAMLKGVAKLIFYPRDCIRFFEDMFLEHGATANNIRDINVVPNLHITNAVMRAYLMLEKPMLVLREYFRYRFHQNRLYPQQHPPEVVSNKSTIAHVFRMALEAAEATRDRKTIARINTHMLYWGIEYRQ
ncbi:hypothetical protein COEREDRAFT_80188 [Coemansia reversa NRRL 1564]|uniref:Pentacotripeptide-repeat region of PRORP domain-containing protein n=1 Tax=Coemansia reversa (strain ATCC 12441 / NRRL 1564) TaxID=763665 RepID=A0A2G5BFU5_COERN|nr:hypothetical protein COEREDRAFT_80188 [Coemansia reversa NRRL 1564]|eukprot:PIA17852.1 hypothetical protein COEREDRAFT_80188 [Coemansia reversa NRRL 1564]